MPDPADRHSLPSDTAHHDPAAHIAAAAALSPSGNSPNAPTSAATLANLLSTALGEVERLKQALDSERHRSAKLAREASLINDPDRAAVVRKLAETESKLEKEVKAREELEGKMKGIRSGWGQLEQYMSMIDVRAADARASFSRNYLKLADVPATAPTSALQASSSRLPNPQAPVLAPAQPAPTHLIMPPPSSLTAQDIQQQQQRATVAALFPSLPSHPTSTTVATSSAGSSTIPRIRPRQDSPHSTTPKQSDVLQPPQKRHKAEHRAAEPYPPPQPPPQPAHKRPHTTTHHTTSHSTHSTSGRPPEIVQPPPRPILPAGPSSVPLPAPTASTSQPHSHPRPRPRTSFTPSPPPTDSLTAELLEAISPPPRRHSKARSLSTSHRVSFTPSDDDQDQSDKDELASQTVDDMIADVGLEDTRPTKSRHRSSEATSRAIQANIARSAAIAPPGTLNAEGLRTCLHCGRPGRYKEGRCVEKWGPGPHGPGTVCDRCRKKNKRAEKRDDSSQSHTESNSAPTTQSQSQSYSSLSSLSSQSYSSLSSQSQSNNSQTLVNGAHSSNGLLHVPPSIPMKRSNSDLGPNGHYHPPTNGHSHSHSEGNPNTNLVKPKPLAHATSVRTHDYTPSPPHDYAHVQNPAIVPVRPVYPWQRGNMHWDVKEEDETTVL